MRLFLLRHGDAEFGVGGTKDITRKLSEKGKEQGRAVNSWLRSQVSSSPLRVYCSGARRTRDTSEIVLESLPNAEITYHDELYYASYKDLLKFVNEIPSDVEEVLLIGHNSAISDFASYILDKEILFPTAGIISIVYPVIDKWEYVGNGTGGEEKRSFL